MVYQQCSTCYTRTMRIRRQSVQLFMLILLLLAISMAGTVVPQVLAPRDRIFAGFHEYSSDYIQYVSYIKEGMYGRMSMYFRSYPFDQPATPIHWIYIFFGILFSPFGLTAPIIYHIIRVILGVLFIYNVYTLFLLLFQKHNLALLSTIIAFTSSCFSWIDTSGIHILNFFPFALSTPQRITDRPHYILGSILFLLVIQQVLRKNNNIFILCALSFTTVMIHIASGIILGLLSLFLFFKNRVHGIIIALGCLLGAVITYYFVTQYSLVSDIFIDRYIYRTPFSFIIFFQQVISFGPLLWLGLPGLLLGIKKQPIFFVWGIIHILIFFFMYPLFRVDNVRFMQSLYFIPLTYGTIVLLVHLKKYMFIGIALLLFVSLPMYVSQVQKDVFAMTDYQSFSVFGFPTENQFAAYYYLDKHSPTESIVLSYYEAANLLLMYSHNRVIGNDQGWSERAGKQMKDDSIAFFTGTQNDNTARSYLTNNHISFIYYGYQEQEFGNISHYPFLKMVYQNPEVTIFQVL